MSTDEWSTIVKAEPRLAALCYEVRVIPQRPELASCEAYDLAYRTLFAAFERRGGVR